MKRISKYMLLLNLGVFFIQPVQAAEEFVKVTAGGGLFYAGLYAAILNQRSKNFRDRQKEVESNIQQNPDRYKVTDKSLTHLI